MSLLIILSLKCLDHLWTSRFILFFNQWDIVIAFILFFWPHCVAGRTLVLQPGIKPIPNAVNLQGPNHWTAKELLPTNFRISLSNSM